MKRKIAFTLFTSALAFAAPAFADEQAPAAAGASAQNSIGDIVVTARRREESSLKVPVSVTAFGAETLRNKSINTPEDLIAHTPGLTLYSGNAQRSDGYFFIRGQGATYGSQPGVITYINEVPVYELPSQGTTAQFFDLSGVQVLKGPQGTLFGRSTTGGAVLLTSQRPTNDLGGNLEVRFGNYNYKEVLGALNVPIIKDKLLLRVAGDFVRRTGFTQSNASNQYIQASGQDLDDKHREYYRVSLLAKPVDGIENLLIFSGQDVNEHGGSVVLKEFNPLWTSPVNFGPPFGVVNVPFYNPGSPLTQGVVGGLCAAISAPGAVAACTAQRLGMISNLVNGTNAELARLAAGGSVRQTDIPQALHQINNAKNITNTTTLHQDGVGVLGDITIKNIFATNAVGTSAANWELSGVGAAAAYNGWNVVNGAVVPYSGDSQAFFQNFSDEFQVQGHSKLLDWTVGYYYSFKKVPSSVGNFFTTFGNALNAYAPLPSPNGQFALNVRSADKGVYAQGTLHPFEGASITAGVRRSNYSQEQTNAQMVFAPGGFTPSPTTVALPYLNQGATSYNFAADYKPMNGMLVYATTRRGFKPGGINQYPATNFPAFQPSFSPEIITDYEAGVKYAWRGPIAGRVSLAGFTDQYSNIQRNFTYTLPGGSGGVFTQVQNIAAGSIKGFELESEFRIGSKLTVGANAAYTDAKYTSWPGSQTTVPTAAFPLGVTTQNVNKAFTNTPKFTWSINARYLLIDEPTLGQVAVSGNYYHQSFAVVDDAFYEDPEHNGAQKAYGLLNLRADWTNVAGKPFDLFVNGTNVANKTVKVGAAGLLSAVGYMGLIYNEPRMVSGGVRVHF